MKYNSVIYYGLKLSLAVLLSMVVACGSDSSGEEEVEIEQIEEPISPIPEPTVLYTTINCNIPKLRELGPSAAASQGTAAGCTDMENPINQGLLDCRTDIGGYSEESGFGVYSVTGGTQRYDGTRARVERSFPSLSRENTKTYKFTGTFIVDDLSSSFTYIGQAHAGGNIVEGLQIGRTATSAQFLVRVRPKPGSTTIGLLDLEESVEPFLSNPSERGRRAFKQEFEINIGVAYEMEVVSGFDTTGKSFSEFKFTRLSDSAVVRAYKVVHSFTTERSTFRYGAYSTGDTGDTSARIRFTNVDYCVQS